MEFPLGTDAPQSSAQTQQMAGQNDEGGPAIPTIDPLSLPGMRPKRGPGRPRSASKARDSKPESRVGGDETTTIRDKQILAMRLAQHSVHEIQNRFKISSATVYRSLSMAQRRAFADHAIDKMMEELIPKAMAAISVALDNGDAELGVRILESMGVLQPKGGGVAPMFAQPQPGATMESFEEYRSRVVRKVTVDADTGQTRVEESRVIDAEPIRTVVEAGDAGERQGERDGHPAAGPDDADVAAAGAAGAEPVADEAGLAGSEEVE